MIVLHLPGMAPSGTYADIAISDRGLGPVLTHIFLVHDLFSRWQMEINPPMWSVSLEWLIYGVFAVTLLPCWKRFGSPALIFGAFAVGIAPALYWAV